MNYARQAVQREYKIFRAAFFVCIFLFSFFAWGADSARALDLPDCPQPAPAGQKNAIFVLSDWDVPLDNLLNPTAVGIVACVAVPAGATEVTYDQLERAGNGQIIFRDNDVMLYEYSPYYADLNVAVRRAAQRQWGLSEVASRVRYNLQRVINATFVDDGKEISESRRYFYGVDFGNRDLELFFIGYEGENQQVQQAIRWTFNGAPATKGLVKVDHGKVSTFTLGVEAVSPADGAVAVTCSQCADVGGTLQLQGNQLTVTLDSRRVVDTMHLALPKDVDFVFKGVTGQGQIKKYSEFTITLHIDLFDCAQFNGKGNECVQNTKCFWFPTKGQCYAKRDTAICTDLPNNLCGEYPSGSKTYPGSELCSWLTFPGSSEAGRCVSPTAAEQTQQYGKPEGYQGPIPDCAWSGSCRNINSLVEVLVKYGTNVFRLIGAMAFVMFVIGGFTMIFSMGNAERAKKGRDILVAAVVGIIIVFSAYLIVKFLLDALQVTSGFRGI